MNERAHTQPSNNDLYGSAFIPEYYLSVTVRERTKEEKREIRIEIIKESTKEFLLLFSFALGQSMTIMGALVGAYYIIRAIG